jgi:hypothetical protein
LHVLSSFQRTGSSGGYFLLVEPCVRRQQANSPRIPNHQDPVNTFFRCLTRRHHRQARRSGSQHSAPHVAGFTAPPLGLGPLGLAGLGCRLPGALEEHAASAAPRDQNIQATSSRCVFDAGAPGKTFEISEKCTGCQPKSFAPSAALAFRVLGARPA